MPIIGLRRKIAEQMVKSVSTAPHFTYVEEVDGTKLVALRKGLKARAAERGVKLTYIPFVMKACSVAFREFPNVPPPTPQPEEGITHAALLEKADGRVDFAKTATQVVDHVRGHGYMLFFAFRIRESEIDKFDLGLLKRGHYVCG